MSVATYDRRTPALAMQDGRRRAWKVGPTTYRVYGREATPYVVEVTNGIPLCNCTAGTGDHGRFRPRACWHAALVLARVQREALIAQHEDATPFEPMRPRGAVRDRDIARGRRAPKPEPTTSELFAMLGGPSSPAFGDGR